MKVRKMKVRKIESGKALTGKWWASCQSEGGPIEQWGDTELDALRRLEHYVTDTMGYEFPHRGL